MEPSMITAIVIALSTLFGSIVTLLFQRKKVSAEAVKFTAEGDSLLVSAATDFSRTLIERVERMEVRLARAEARVIRLEAYIMAHGLELPPSDNE